MNHPIALTMAATGRWLFRHLPASAWRVNLALFDQALVSAVNFGTGILAARYLAPEEFGRYVLAFMVVTAANIFQQSLVLDPMLSIGSKKEGETAGLYFSAVLLHQVGLGLALSVTIFVGAWCVGLIFPAWDLSTLSLPMVLATIGFQCQELLRRYFFVRHRIGMAIINDGLRYGTQVLAIFCLLKWFGDRATGSDVLLIIAASSGLAVIHGLLNSDKWRWQRDAVASATAENWRYSKWLVASSGLRAFNTIGFMSAAGYVYGALAAGELRAAQNLVAFIHIFYLGLENFALVKAAHAFGRYGVDALRSVVTKLAVFGGGVTIASLALVCLYAGRILALLYGDRYLHITDLVYLWAIAYAFMFFTLPAGVAIRAMEQSRHILVVDVLQTLFSVVATYPLLMYFGASGAVIGTAAANVIILVYFVFMLSKMMRRPVTAAPTDGLDEANC
jgi:O-antigen/teichoic acid export membrane protein